MISRIENMFTPRQGSWVEWLLAAIPFLVICIGPGLITATGLDSKISPIAGIGIILTGILMLMAIGIIGLLVRLPRWTMPYAGILLSLIGFTALSAAGAQESVFKTGSIPFWARLLIYDAFYLVLMAFILVLVLVVARQLSITQTFYDKAREDWPILSLAMYGGSAIFILGHFEDTAGAGLYLIAVAIVFAAGVWGFLRSSTTTSRLLSIIGAITAASAIAWLGTMNLVPFTSSPEVVIGSMVISRAGFSIIAAWILSVGLLFLPALTHQIFPSPTAKPLESV